MERFVRIIAPVGRLDFFLKLLMFLLICGGLNHFRDLVQNGLVEHSTFWNNFGDAAFTALPMCTLALLLIGHLNLLQKRLYLQATHDLLTGLHNRRWFMDNTHEQLGPDQTLLIIDIDRFKLVNDTFGHAVGDMCLQATARHLRSMIRKSDFCARIGGEEFAVLLNGADPHGVRKVANGISAGFKFRATDQDVIQVTASVGVAQDVLSRSQAFKLADDAVYKAKEAGRARYVIADAEHHVDMPLLPTLAI